MPKHKTSKEAFAECERDGFYKEQVPPTPEEIQTMMRLGDAIVRQAQRLIPLTPKDSIDWTVIYTMHYDALHQMTEAFLQLYKIKVSNHQCMFAYLCEKHPELQLDWGFLEEFRTRRNGAHYYGTPVSYVEWKKRELQINLYIATLKNAIEQKIKT